LDEPYYSTVYTGRPDAIEMKENDAYGRPRPARQKIIVEETLRMELLGRMVVQIDKINFDKTLYQLLCL